jgi:hypothetical protein
MAGDEEDQSPRTRKQIIQYAYKQITFFSTSRIGKEVEANLKKSTYEIILANKL